MAATRQANFRLSEHHIELINTISEQQEITKAAVVERAVDLLWEDLQNENSPKTPAHAAPLQASAPVAAQPEPAPAPMAPAAPAVPASAPDSEPAPTTIITRGKVERRSRESAHEAPSAPAPKETKAVPSAPVPAPAPAPKKANPPEVQNIVQTVAKATAKAYKDKTDALEASLSKEIQSLKTSVEEKDVLIRELRSQLGMAQDDHASTREEAIHAIKAMSLLPEVTDSVKQQVAYARDAGREEGRREAAKDVEQRIADARAAGYEAGRQEVEVDVDAVAAEARKSGAFNERAKIANMQGLVTGEKRRYLRVHVTM